MPTPVTHLALAEEILRPGALSPTIRRLLIQQRGPFLLGHTAPDVQAISGQPRSETHFYTVPRASDVPAWEALSAAHPRLARAELLPPAQAAFVAGYTAHLLLDELWLDDVFLRHFRGDWAAKSERKLLHNVLRTWMDRRDHRRLNGTVVAALREVQPRGWLPFVGDEHLEAWRDWLVSQLGSGQRLQTAKVFAQRMGVPPETLESVLNSPRQMEERVFRRISRARLRSFYEVGHRRSVELITQYLYPISKEVKP